MHAPSDRKYTDVHSINARLQADTHGNPCGILQRNNRRCFVTIVAFVELMTRYEDLSLFKA